ncbi:sensor histidine kinase [Granulicoccus sp. GXG6511]|uniref:sensor histidine kinase n=1 Tax=Granulicoccus sp. GXG6511 TaxID=3381351 RepID=UPI003D7CDB3A
MAGGAGETGSTDTADLLAPGFDPDAQELPWWRRMIAQGVGYFAPSTVFVAIPVVFSIGQPLPRVVAVSLASLVIGALFIGATLIMHWSERGRWGWLGAMVVAIAALGVSSTGDARPTYFATYVSAAGAVLIPWRRARILIMAVTLVVLITALVQRDLFGVVMAAMALAIGLSVGLGLETERTRRALRVAEERTAVLAVTAERERIGRDLHDILGHSLTTIAVKADLAGRLVGRDDEAARAEVDSLATIARQALGDVRATASGMREVRLATEIASARSVLAAAGVEAITPSAMPLLEDGRSELFGYVLREAVTNVVRHAEATTCTITCDSEQVTITDDGRGLTGRVPGSGSGLAGLRARIEEAGGSLLVESGGRGTTVTARLEPVA